MGASRKCCARVLTSRKFQSYDWKVRLTDAKSGWPRERWPNGQDDTGKGEQPRCSLPPPVSNPARNRGPRGTSPDALFSRWLLQQRKGLTEVERGSNLERFP